MLHSVSHLSGHDWFVIALLLIMGAGLMAGILRILIYDFDGPVVPRVPLVMEREGVPWDTNPRLDEPLKDPPWTPEQAERSARAG